MQGARISQLEDVVNRYQLLTDQAIERLDGDAQRQIAANSRTAYALNDLRAARDAIFTEIGVEKMQARVRAGPIEPQFGQTHAFRSRGGSGGGSAGNTRSYPHDAPYEPNEYEAGRWQQRRGRGGRR